MATPAHGRGLTLASAATARYGPMMALHLLKLCVGVASVADLEARMAGHAGSGGIVHVTRMVPPRAAEILAGGSLYWVVRGALAARQSVRDIRPIVDAQGIRRCELVLEPTVVPVLPRPCRPFQGWRYLAETERPPDVATGDARDLPEALLRELRDLCLI